VADNLLEKLKISLKLNELIIKQVWNLIPEVNEFVGELNRIVSSEVGQCYAGLKRDLIESKILIFSSDPENCGPYIGLQGQFQKSQ
jgi:hypothetical protein